MTGYPTIGPGQRAPLDDGGTFISPCCAVKLEIHDITRWRDAFSCGRCGKVWVLIGDQIFEGQS